MDDPALFMPHLEFTQNLGLTLIRITMENNQGFDSQNGTIEMNIILSVVINTVVSSITKMAPGNLHI